MNHERAGLPANPADLVDVAHLVSTYYTVEPDADDIVQRVAFGTSGHRGSSLTGSFNEAHIVATTHAICEYRAMQSISGPLFLGRDTHALSEPAWATALEVLAANDVTVLIDVDDRYTPTPAISHAILRYNSGRTTGADLADADSLRKWADRRKDSDPDRGAWVDWLIAALDGVENIGERALSDHFSNHLRLANMLAAGPNGESHFFTPGHRG